MKGLKLLITAVAALALLAMPGAALAKSRDRNHDGIPDKWEKANHLSTKANVARQDPDHDGLANISEFRHGTNPNSADTDGDGVGDKQELQDHMNPTSAGDEQEVSGTVASFDGTTLVIQLPGTGAGTVTGTVTSATEVECSNDGSGDSSSTTTATMSEDSGSSDSADTSGSTSSGDGSSTSSGDNSTTSGDNTSTTTSGEDDANENQQAPPCTIAVGDVVHEAKFVQSDSGNTFTKVELTK